MRIEVITAKTLSYSECESCLIVPLYEKAFPLQSAILQEEDELALQALADKEVLVGKKEECYYLPTPTRAYQGVLTLGLGKQAQFNAEIVRRAVGKAVASLSANRIAQVILDISHFPEFHAPAFVEGLSLAQYDFDAYKEAPKDGKAVTVSTLTILGAESQALKPLRESVERAAMICMGANGARHLANTPANEMTPEALAEFARGIAAESEYCDCTVLEPAQMASLNMNALLGVAKGSANEARLIVLDYRHPEAEKTVALVGKGVTFDSGGISIKPSQGMEEMKFDMCGAAAVLCTMMTITQLAPQINLLCVAPAVENKTGANAQCPGDIVTACNGKTIEVHNTDAEGRLILADAMAYTIEKYAPEAIIDVATLTGACVVALGHYAAGLFSNDDALSQALLEAGEAQGERLWRLPIWEEYAKLIEGTHADICNIGPRGEAGAVTAACFLQHFAGKTPWAHLDIAGTAWGGKNISYLNAKHATGFGVRLLTQWVLNQSSAS